MMNRKTVSSINESQKEYPYKNKKDKRYVNAKQYKEIMQLFMKKLVYKLIKTGNLIKLPSRLGTLKIYRYNAKKLRKYVESIGKKFYAINYHKTKELQDQGIDRIVRYDNRSTNGYWWKLKWSKSTHANFRHKSMYALKLSRPNIRPNSYNDNNPELSIVPYFREKGWMMYSELPIIDKRENKTNNDD